MDTAVCQIVDWRDRRTRHHGRVYHAAEEMVERQFLRRCLRPSTFLPNLPKWPQLLAQAHVSGRVLLPNHQHALRLVRYRQLLPRLPHPHEFTRRQRPSLHHGKHPWRRFRMALPRYFAYLLRPRTRKPPPRFKQILHDYGLLLVWHHGVSHLRLCLHHRPLDSNGNASKGLQYLRSLQKPAILHPHRFPRFNLHSLVRH